MKKLIFGAAAMSLSSFTVCMNALRLNLAKIYIGKTEQPAAVETAVITEDRSMTKTMKIEGMMCGHCEARVKKVLEALDGVETAEVSHEKGTAVVTLSSAVEDDVLKKAVEEQDYKVISVS